MSRQMFEVIAADGGSGSTNTGSTSSGTTTTTETGSYQTDVATETGVTTEGPYYITVHDPNITSELSGKTIKSVTAHATRTPTRGAILTNTAIYDYDISAGTVTIRTFLRSNGNTGGQQIVAIDDNLNTEGLLANSYIISAWATFNWEQTSTSSSSNSSSTSSSTNVTGTGGLYIIDPSTGQSIYVGHNTTTDRLNYVKDGANIDLGTLSNLQNLTDEDVYSFTHPESLSGGVGASNDIYVAIEGGGGTTSYEEVEDPVPTNDATPEYYDYEGTPIANRNIRKLSTTTYGVHTLSSTIYASMSGMGYYGGKDLDKFIKAKSLSSVPNWAEVEQTYGYKYKGNLLKFTLPSASPIFKTSSDIILPLSCAREWADTSKTYYLRYYSSKVQYKEDTGSWTNLSSSNCRGCFVALVGAGGGGAGSCGLCFGTAMAGCAVGGGGGGGGAFALVYVNLYQIRQTYGSSANVRIRVGSGGSAGGTGGGWELFQGAGGASASGGYGNNGGGTTLSLYTGSSEITLVTAGGGSGGGNPTIGPTYWQNNQGYVPYTNGDGWSGGVVTDSTSSYSSYVSVVTAISGKAGGDSGYMSYNSFGGNDGNQTGDAGGEYSTSDSFDLKFFVSNPKIRATKNEWVDSKYKYYYRGRGTPSGDYGTSGYRSEGGGGGASPCSLRIVHGDSITIGGYGCGGQGGTGVANTVNGELYSGKGGIQGVAFLLTNYWD